MGLFEQIRIWMDIYDQSMPPDPKFHAEDINDLTGKVYIVTGSNTGVGKEIVKGLLAKNAKVYMAVRSQDRAKTAIDDLWQSTGKTAVFLKLDLSDLHSVKAAAKEFLSQETRLDALFNNGGVMTPPMEEVTAQGYDLQFGTNVLGHFYLTKLLLPVLLSTTKVSPDGKARVVNTSSSTQVFTGLDFATFKDGSHRRNSISTKMLYAQSKHGNVVFSNELAHRYGAQGIVSTALNPGNLKSDLQRHVWPFTRFLLHLISWEPWYGALTPLWAGTSPEGASFNGKYLIPWARIGAAREDTQDPRIGKALWEWMEEQVATIE